MSEKFGLVFEDDADDLSPLKIAVVKGSFGIAGLIERDDAPFEGTLVYVDYDADLDRALEQVVSEFGLVCSDITWSSTDPS